MEEMKYYGIYFNENIPELDKINQYSKEVKIEFDGEAYLIERDKEERIVRKIEIQNEHILKKEGEYEIEFINKMGEKYNLLIKIETSYWFFIWLPLILGMLILLFSRQTIAETLPKEHFWDFINLSILQLDKDISTKEERNKDVYQFDIEKNKTSSKQAKLVDSISMDGVAKDKIAPRSKR